MVLWNKFILFLILSFFTTNVLAHPHHETEVVALLGLDHIFYGLLVIVGAFALFGKLSK